MHWRGHNDDVCRYFKIQNGLVGYPHQKDRHQTLMRDGYFDINILSETGNSKLYFTLAAPWALLVKTACHSQHCVELDSKYYKEYNVVCALFYLLYHIVSTLSHHRNYLQCSTYCRPAPTLNWVPFRIFAYSSHPTTTEAAACVRVMPYGGWSNTSTMSSLSPLVLIQLYEVFDYFEWRGERSADNAP